MSENKIESKKVLCQLCRKRRPESLMDWMQEVGDVCCICTGVDTEEETDEKNDEVS